MITLVAHDSGNLAALEGALDRLGFASVLARRPEQAAPSGPLILAGNGAFERAQAALKASGWWFELPQRVAEGRCLLAFNLGLHLLAEGSEECPRASGLGMIPGLVRRLGPGVKVPHLGWAKVQQSRPNQLLPDPHLAWLHFQHAFALEPCGETLWIAEHGRPFSVLEARGRVAAFQADLHRSGVLGLGMLGKILEWAGESPRAIGN